MFKKSRNRECQKEITTQERYNNRPRSEYTALRQHESHTELTTQVSHNYLPRGQYHAHR